MYQEIGKFTESLVWTMEEAMSTPFSIKTEIPAFYSAALTPLPIRVRDELATGQRTPRIDDAEPVSGT
jgi:hypothetical protein